MRFLSCVQANKKSVNYLMETSIFWSLLVPELECAKLLSYLYTALQSGTCTEKLLLSWRRDTEHGIKQISCHHWCVTEYPITAGGKKTSPFTHEISYTGKIRLQLNTPPIPLSSHSDHHQVNSLHKRRNFWKAFITFHSVSASREVQQTSESSSFWSTCVHQFSFISGRAGYETMLQKW